MTSQNIVIIGASCAGHNLANQLVGKIPDDYRLLLIDSMGFAAWPVASLRGAVVPGWEKRVTAPVTTEYIFPTGSKHQVVAPNKVVELKASSVVLEKPFEGSTEIPFFKCVLATGAAQPAPMRPRPGASIEEYHEQLRGYQENFGKATKIVIIGGGAVGTEMSGEIRARWPDKEITVVHSLSHILNPTATPAEAADSKPRSWSAEPSPAKLSAPIEQKMKEMEIDLILNDKVIIPSDSIKVTGDEDWDGSFGLQNTVKNVKLQSGNTIQADFVFVSVGNKANSELVERADKDALVDGMGKMIDVDEYLRVRSSSPTSILKENYYAIGDCAASPGFKTSQTALSDATGCAVNLLNEINDRPLKEFIRSVIHGYMIPLGPDTGVGVLTLPYLGTVTFPNFMLRTIKYTKLFVEDAFYARFKGAEQIPKFAIPAQ